MAMDDCARYARKPTVGDTVILLAKSICEDTMHSAPSEAGVPLEVVSYRGQSKDIGVAVRGPNGETIQRYACAVDWVKTDAYNNVIEEPDTFDDQKPSERWGPV